MVRLGAGVQWPLPRVGDGQRRGDDADLTQRPELGCSDEHAAEAGIQRKASHGPTLSGELAIGEGAEFVQQRQGILDRLGFRRIEKGEALDVAEAERPHLQHHRSEVHSLDFRFGVSWARRVVRFGVEANAQTRADSPATAPALVGAGLGNGFDGQPLQLGAVAVAVDARLAGVHDKADVGHGDGGFRDVGGEHDAPLGTRLKHPLLVVGGKAGVERQNVKAAGERLAQKLRRLEDFPLAGLEDEQVLGGALGGCLDGLDGPEQVGLLILARLQVAGLDRVAAAAHLDDRGVAKVLREAVHINGCAGDDELQIPTLGEQLVQVAEQEVDVQAALVRLVHDDGVVSGELAVTTDLGEQQTVGHHLDGG